MTVICIHGLASSAATWDRLRAQLDRREIPSHALTLLGHHPAAMPGRYSFTGLRDDALRQIDQVEAERVSLVGHSLGAFVATMVAAARPELIERLVLEEPPVPRRGPTRARPFTRRSELRMRITRGWSRRRFDPRMLGQVLDGLLTPQPSWWESLRRIEAPTLVLAGGHSSYLDQDGIAQLAAVLPRARLVTVAAGHRIHTARPEPFLDDVLPFLTAPQVSIPHQ